MMMMMMINKSVYYRCSKVPLMNCNCSWMACNSWCYSWYSTNLQRDGQAELVCMKQEQGQVDRWEKSSCDAEDFWTRSNGWRVLVFIRWTSWTLTVALFNTICHCVKLLLMGWMLWAGDGWSQLNEHEQRVQCGVSRDWEVINCHTLSLCHPAL